MIEPLRIGSRIEFLPQNSTPPEPLAIGDLQKDSFTLMKIFRIVTTSIIAIDYYRRGVSPDVLKLCDKLDMTNTMVNSFLFCMPVEYILTKDRADQREEGAHCLEKDLREKRYWSILASASFGAVGTALILSLLDGVGMLSLANWRAQLRKISFLEKTICKVSFDTTVRVGANLGFFSAVKDKLSTISADKYKRRNDTYKIAWFASEIVVDALTMCSVAFPILTCFKVGAAVLGIWSHLYHESLNRARAKDKEKGPNYDPLELEPPLVKKKNK